jgi:hypothetical protein
MTTRLAERDRPMVRRVCQCKKSAKNGYSVTTGCVRVFGRSFAAVSNPKGGMDACLVCVCCVLLGGGLCVGLITGKEESLAD